LDRVRQQSSANCIAGLGQPHPHQLQRALTSRRLSCHHLPAACSSHRPCPSGKVLSPTAAAPGLHPRHSLHSMPHLRPLLLLLLLLLVPVLVLLRRRPAWAARPRRQLELKSLVKANIAVGHEEHGGLPQLAARAIDPGAASGGGGEEGVGHGVWRQGLLAGGGSPAVALRDRPACLSPPPAE